MKKPLSPQIFYSPCRYTNFQAKLSGSKHHALSSHAPMTDTQGSFPLSTILTLHTHTFSDTKQYRQDGVSLYDPSTVLNASLHLALHRSFTDHVTYYSKEKMHINVVVIGHVDSGKSTTTGTACSLPLPTDLHAHYS